MAKLGFVVLGARIGWKTLGGVRIEGFATWLFDKAYFLSRTDLNEVAPRAWARPRQFGIMLSGTL